MAHPADMTHITVPDQTPSADFAVTSPQSSFAISFTVFDKTDLRVTVNSVEVEQADFDFFGTLGFEGGYPGGIVTFGSSVSNSVVRIWSEMPPARTNDFLEGAGLPARSINTELDRLTARARDIRLRFQRTPTLAFATDHTLTEDEAGQLFTNEGASGTRNFTLPPASAGLRFEFAVVVAFSLVVKSSTGTALFTGAAIGDIIAIRGFDDGTWKVESSAGSWS